MNYIANFKIGDKLYKKKGETVDETIIYEITEIWEEEDGNWHDGYQKILYVPMEGEIDPYLLAYKILGGGCCLYGVYI
jgi:hypothetical protein